MQNTNLSVSDTGSLLMGVGFAKLDDLKVGLVIVTVGVLLKVLAGYLANKGIATFQG